jgi:two-component system response regulator DevR
VRPDVAVLDARLPDGSGIEVCREIRSSLPSVACLILTSYDDDESLFAATMAGAAGYVLKQIRGTDLVAAVHRVARGQSLLDPTVTATVLARLREGPPAPDPRWEALSDREREVLALIAEGLSNREIGARLYLAEKTVKNHVSRLLAKLQMQRRTQIAVFGATLRDQGTLRPQHPESRVPSGSSPQPGRRAREQRLSQPGACSPHSKHGFSRRVTALVSARCSGGLPAAGTARGGSAPGWSSPAACR